MREGLREAVLAQMRKAFTVEQVEAAMQLQAEWLKLHPDDRDLGEIGVRLQALAAQELLGPEGPRNSLSWQMAKADTGEEIRAAREALQGWLARHPDDWGLRREAEQLDMMEGALELIEREKSGEAA